MAKKKEVIKGYMCQTDFMHELGCASGGINIYSSIEDLKQCRPCVEECGIVEVNVTLSKVIQESEFKFSSED